MIRCGSGSSPHRRKRKVPAVMEEVGATVAEEDAAEVVADAEVRPTAEAARLHRPAR